MALVTVAAILWAPAVVVLWLSALAGLIQLFDGYVGTQMKNLRTTWGPIVIAVLQFAALAWVVFGCFLRGRLSERQQSRQARRSDAVGQRDIHNGMPVIVHSRDFDRWLNNYDESRPPLDLLRPFESDKMRMTPANRLVGNVHNNGPEMLNSA